MPGRFGNASEYITKVSERMSKAYGKALPNVRRSWRRVEEVFARLGNVLERSWNDSCMVAWQGYSFA